MYKNQHDIDKIQERIKEISPSLRLGCFWVEPDTNIALSAGFVIPIKGNKKIIEQLEAIGFRKIRKRMMHGNRGIEAFSEDRFVFEMMIALPKK